MLKSLEAMLNEPSILYEIEYSHNNRQPGRICDFCDGELFQRHPLFSRDKSALQIILYCDEVECVNPLGSKTKKHKLGMYTVHLVFIYFCTYFIIIFNKINIVSNM